MELLNYLLKVSACLMLFFAFYLIVLNRLTFFKINRFYLLGTLILSFIIPALQFTIEREIAQTAAVHQPIAVQDVDLGAPTIQEPIQVGTGPVSYEMERFDWYALLPYAYGSIVAILLLLTMWRLIQLLKYTNEGVERRNGLKIVAKTKGFTNCSFFNYVFVDDDKLTETELNVLLRHEEVHAKQFHSIDKIILMIAKAVLWFNPIIYLYDKALEQTHEYEADEATSANFGANNYASLLLRLAVEKGRVPLVHNFVKSPIKARIKMLFNDKSKTMKKLMYLLVLPLGLALIWGFTVNVVEVATDQNSGQDSTFTLVVDAGHGGKNVGAQVSGYSEKDITLSVAKKIKAIAEAKGIKVVLTRTNDEEVELATRAKVNGTVLLSLHVGSDPSKLKNGMEMFVSGTYIKEDSKFINSYGLTYHLFKSLKNISGLKINSKPNQSKRFVILENATSPGILLEMGYLTNNADLKYLTNDEKQTELATSIVNGILIYKEKLPERNEFYTKFVKTSEEFNIKYSAWLKSPKHASLTAAAKEFKAQKLIGIIQSLNYFQRGTKPDLDGFILKTRNQTYRIYLTKQQLAGVKFKAGDEVSLFAPKAEVWFDSDYPVIQPKTIALTGKVGVLHKIQNPRLISSTTVTVDPRTGISYFENAKMEMGERLILEGDNIMWNKQAGLITAKKGVLKSKDGKTVVTGESIRYDLRFNTYSIKNASGKVAKSKSSVFQLLENLPYNASDSIRVSKTSNSITLYGKAKITIDNNVLSGDKIEVNKESNIITAYNAQLTSPETATIFAKKIEFNPTTKKTAIYGVPVVKSN